MNRIPVPDNPEERLLQLEAVSDPQQRREAIRAAMEDETTLVRERAIALAARYLEPEVLAEMVADDDNAVLRNAALGALERQGPYAIPCLKTMTADDNYEVAMFAVNVLARVMDSSTIPVLLPLLEHPDINVAQAAIEAVANVRAKPAVPILLRLTQGEMWLQFAAVVALGEIGDPRAIGSLLELVDNPMLSEAAIEALGKIAAADSLEPLLALLLGDDRTLQRDKLMLSIAAVLEKHPYPQPVVERFAKQYLNDERLAGLLVYLRAAIAGTLEILEKSVNYVSPGSEDDRAGARQMSPLVRAAANFALAARLETLYPVILSHTVDASGVKWVADLFRHYRQGVRDSRESLLRHEDPQVRRGFLLVADFTVEDLSLLLRALGDSHPSVQAAACLALGEMRCPEAVPALVEKLIQGDQEVQASAADALGRMPGSSLQPLAPYLEESNVDLQRIILEIIVASDCQLFAEAASRILQQGPPTLRRHALRALSNDRRPETEDILISRLEGMEEAVRIEALELLITRGCVRAVPRMIQFLQQENPLRYHIIRGLGQLERPEATEPLQAIYQQANALEKIEIVAALSRIGVPSAIDFLKERLKETDNEIRRVAAFGLARLGTERDLPLLQVMAEDEDWYLRNEAGWGLGRLGLPAGRALLMNLARDVEPVVARTARAALTKLA